MCMVCHDNPSIYKTFTFSDVLAEAIEKSHLVLIVVEDVRLIDPSYHDVVKGARDV